MEQRVSLITLGVENLLRSLRFYETLGWEPVAGEWKDVAFFQLPGMALALWGRGDLAEDAGLSPEGTGFRAVALAYNARSRAEVDAVLAEAEAAGGRIAKPAEDVFWGGYCGYFADPDDHLWEVAWNPGFTLAEDGSLRIR